MTDRWSTVNPHPSDPTHCKDGTCDPGEMDISLGTLLWLFTNVERLKKQKTTAFVVF